MNNYPHFVYNDFKSATTPSIQKYLIIVDGCNVQTLNVCVKDGCTRSTTHDSEKFCYPHSRWYRPFKVIYNHCVRKLDDWGLLI